MFSDSLLTVLTDGHKDFGPRLSFIDLGELVRDRIKETYRDMGVRPEVHSPDQETGDVAHVPLFPNPAWAGSTAKRAKTEMTLRKMEERERDEAERQLAEAVARKEAERRRLATLPMSSDPIEHVIILMLGNRSFDHMLGVLQQIYPDLDGVPPGAPPRTDTDSKTGAVYQQLPNTERQLNPSPLHENLDVLLQMSKNMSGFIDDYSTVPGSNPADYPAVMGYYPMDFLPVLHTLARNFTICDRWFCSLPGPTWPNRFFVHSATCNGHVTMPDGFYHPDIPAFHQPQDTIYNRLQDKGISWGIFHNGLSQALLLEKLWDHPLHFHPIERFYEMCQNPDRSDYPMPKYCFLEPAFRGDAEDDQHPPADVMNGELLIANVYNAVRSSPMWNKCLLVRHLRRARRLLRSRRAPHCGTPEALTEDIPSTNTAPGFQPFSSPPWRPKVSSILSSTTPASFATQKTNGAFHP